MFGFVVMFVITLWQMCVPVIMIWLAQGG